MKKNENIVVKSYGEINYEVIPVREQTDNAVAELKISDENGLLFTRKLYSI